MNRFLANSPLSGMPPVVLNLIILNAIFFLGKVVVDSSGGDLGQVLGMYYYNSPHFKPWQIITHMFMHGNFMHLFFNMFALFIFGPPLENYWGGKRFFIYYIITGFGAFILHYTVIHFQIQSLLPQVSEEELRLIFTEGRSVLLSGRNYVDPAVGELNALYNIPVVGASGAVFGILLAFGMLYPNVELFLLFLPIPIKAKYFVIMYGALELWQGLANQPGDNVAHFAHLGGMLFGYILIKIWHSR